MSTDDFENKIGEIVGSFKRDAKIKTDARNQERAEYAAFLKSYVTLAADVLEPALREIEAAFKANELDVSVEIKEPIHYSVQGVQEFKFIVKPIHGENNRRDHSFASVEFRMNPSLDHKIHTILSVESVIGRSRQSNQSWSLDDATAEKLKETLTTALSDMFATGRP